MADSKKTEDILIDSSSLFLALKDRSLTIKLINWLSDTKAQRRLLFSPLVFEEMLDSSDKAFVIEQLLDLGILARELGNERFAWAPMPDDAFRQEALGEISQTPVVKDEEARSYLECLTNRDSVVSFVKRYQSEPQKWKAETLNFDLRARIRAQEKVKVGNSNLGRDNIIRLLQGYSGPAVGSPFLQQVMEEINTATKVARRQEDVVSQPRRYPFLYAWTCLAELNGLGNALPNGDLHEIAHRLRPDKGSWFDNSIGATAALSTSLITQDRGLIWKCRHLEKAGLVQFTTYRLDEILENS
jgi:hypothetical protein